MKKLLFAAACALAILGSCQKNTEEEKGISLVFTAEEPALTRTAWNGEGILWSAGDRIQVMVDYGTHWTGFFGSDPLASGGAAARFTVQRVTPGSGACRYHAIYPYDAPRDLSEAPLLKVNVPVIQTPEVDSFDPSADLMAGASQPYDSFPDLTSIPLWWSRVVAHGDITLTNLDITPGETLKEITLSVQDGADLTGDFWLDLASDITPESVAPTDDNLTSNIVTVLPDNLVLQGGSLHFWISIMPATVTSLTVTVETGSAKYVKSFSGFEKTFAQNARNLLSISMAGAVRTATQAEDTEPTHYELVTSAPASWEGHYVIVTPDATRILTGVDGSNGTSAEIDVSGGKIAYTAGKPYDIEVAAVSNGFTLKLGSQYLGLAENKNSISASADGSSDSYHWTLSYTGGHVRATSVAFPGRYLQWNSSAKIFRCYTGGQQEVDFYRANGNVNGGGGGGGPVTPTVNTAGVSGITTSSAVLSATYTGNATYAGFEYGTSESLGESQQAELTQSGQFSVQIDDLGDGITYYYRAYIAVLEGFSYQFYYGDIRSFTTLSAGSVTDGDQPGWFEVPLMHTKKSGSYLVNANDANQYYAWHICAGGEKAAGGNPARNYTVCFSAEDHCPLWVAAPRHAMFVGNSGRNEAYKADPKIPASIQYSSKSTGGGCNKGHMLGSAERTCSAATNRQVFHYSNIAPQLSANFNTGGGRWNVLEDYVDTQVCADTLYEVLGCYFQKYTDAYGETQTPYKISFGGRDDVSIPTMFYYVLLRTKSGNSGKAVTNCSSDELQCVAFVRAHVNVRQAVSSRELMSVADLEAITGVTYFPNVPNAPKTTFNASDWDL